MRRGERRERCFFMLMILGSCCTTCLPFFPSRFDGEARAETGLEVEKRAVAVRDVVEVCVIGAKGDDRGAKIERMELELGKSRGSGARRLNVDAILLRWM